MDLVWKYKLKTPATLGERTVETLEFKRPKTKDFLRVDGKSIESAAADLELASSLTGEPSSLLAEIDIDDWAVIRNHLAKVWAAYFGIKENFTEQTAEQEATKPTV